MTRHAARIHFDADGGDLGGFLSVFGLASCTTRVDVRLHPYTGESGALTGGDPEIGEGDDEGPFQFADVANVISMRDSGFSLTPAPSPACPLRGCFARRGELAVLTDTPPIDLVRDR